MIIGFADQTTRDIYDGRNTKDARKIPNVLWSAACRKLDMLNAAGSLGDFKAPPGNRLEALSGNRSGTHSVRINDQYRLVFRWSDGGARDVCIIDYH